MRKCVVTPKGETYVDLTPQEESARAQEDARFRDPSVDDARKDIAAAQLLNRGINVLLLDTFWILFRAIGPVGVPEIDNAVNVDNRTEFDQYFRDRVKSRL